MAPSDVVPIPATCLADLTVPPPPPSRADWNDDGVAIFHDLIPGYLLDAYAEEWIDAHGYPVMAMDWPGGNVQQVGYEMRRPGGWPHATPYMEHEALRVLCCDSGLGVELERLTGEPMGVHLNLTGWVTTERDWHQDSYLNPPEVGDYYAAVWVALADIHPESGPFQYVPGSHRWPQVTRAKIWEHVDGTDPRWPKHSERVLVPLFTEEIRARKAPVVTYLPKRGDVLVWHGRLLHRGSRARQAGLERRALIAHYSGIAHRPDMPRAVQHERGGWYFPLDSKTPV